MTMQELSPQYARQAEAVSRRLRELRHQALTEGDPERVQALRRRQQELRPLLQEARELARQAGAAQERLNKLDQGALDAIVAAMAAAFELADFGPWRAIIESVVYEGLYAVGAAVLNGTFRKGHRRKQRKAGA